MRLLAHTSVSVLFSLLLTPVCAAAQSAVPAAAQGFSVDSRLQQKVAVHAEGIPVSDLLVLLGRKTGVSLKADPYVADDKVAAFSPARSLRSTLLDLAALFNDTWEEAPLADGRMRYTLVRRLKAQRYEDGLEQQVTARMKALLDAQVKALGETQQAMAREAFGEVVTTLKALDEAHRVNFPNVHIVIDAPEMLARHGLRFRLNHTNNSGLSAEVLQVILGANTCMTMGSFESRDQWLLPAHRNPYLPTEKLNISALPASKSVLEAAKNIRWIDRLSALASTECMPIFSDCYRSPAQLHQLSSDAVVRPGEPALSPEAAALDTLGQPSGLLWWRRGGTLLLRKRDWYTQRRYEVPDRWMRALQQRLQNMPTP